MKAEEMSRKQLASFVDYAVLKPELSESEITAYAKEGTALGCASICINPGYIELCEPIVEGTATKICPVTDFPFGTSSTESRIAQIHCAADHHAVAEVDIVMNYGKLKSHLDEEVTTDLKLCADAAHEKGCALKVILETDALSEEEIRRGCECIIHAGADFIKTSTGFLTGHELKGASNECIRIILDQNRGRIKVKGSGCVRTRQHFLELLNMGVDRLGVNYTSVKKILEEGE
jgi:deoxyribose-phosphate aldolase